MRIPEPDPSPAILELRLDRAILGRIDALCYRMSFRRAPYIVRAILERLGADEDALRAFGGCAWREECPAAGGDVPVSDWPCCNCPQER